MLIEKFVEEFIEAIAVRGRKPIGGQDRPAEQDDRYKLTHGLSVSVETAKSVERVLDAVRRHRGESSFLDADAPAGHDGDRATIELVVSEWWAGWPAFDDLDKFRLRKTGGNSLTLLRAGTFNTVWHNVVKSLIYA